mmetsp:Transcript_18210/g.47495  ORF Transcript_18210/g.47495 Transcript_18210/m.47495 type:complete len:215 (+) Transcript_18210:123-767(+)
MGGEGSQMGSVGVGRTTKDRVAAACLLLCGACAATAGAGDGEGAGGLSASPHDATARCTAAGGTGTAVIRCLAGTRCDPVPPGVPEAASYCVEQLGELPINRCPTPDPGNACCSNGDCKGPTNGTSKCVAFSYQYCGGPMPLRINTCVTTMPAGLAMDTSALRARPASLRVSSVPSHRSACRPSARRTPSAAAAGCASRSRPTTTVGPTRGFIV